MSVRLRILLAFICAVSFLPMRQASAQRGQLIEGLFKTLAETHMERERQKRIDAEKLAKQRVPTKDIRPKTDPYKVQLPSGFGGPATRPGTRPVPAPTTPQAQQGAINVRSREAAKFAEQLVGFNQQMAPLVADLRSASVRNPKLRGLMPEAYSLAAEGRALLQSCDGLSSLQPIVQSYGSLDSRWRQLSFNLRGMEGLSQNCSTAIKRCDEYCGAMGKQLRIEPQFDRHALHDVMMAASTYMLVLEDDLHIVIPSEAQCRRLSHDLRLLRQKVLREADHVENVSYDQIVASFNDYAGRWREFSKQVYAINNPHLHRRLDRISECGEQTYRLLWMTPPANPQDLTGAIHRIEHGLEEIMGQLTLRSMIRLKPQEQIKLLDTCRSLNTQAAQLQKLGDQGASAAAIRDTFTQIDRGWNSIQGYFQQIPSINRGTIDEVNRACEEIRGGLGVGQSSQVSATRLLQSAAALEGTSEYLRNELRRFDRQLRPSSFRDSTRNAANEFHHHSKELHELLDRPSRLSDAGYLQKLQREAEHLLEGWDQLAKNMQTIESHGVSAADARRLRGIQRDVMPHVAQIAAALLQ